MGSRAAAARGLAMTVGYRMKWPLSSRVRTVTCSVCTSIWATAGYSFLRKDPRFAGSDPPRVREGLRGFPPKVHAAPFLGRDCR